MSEPIELDRLKRLLRYDPETGQWTWLESTNPKIKSGDIAGSAMCNGYWRVRVDGKEYLSHRLAWLYVTGEWPVKFIDHINMDRGDNRWANLRQASHQQNTVNSKVRSDNPSGRKGVTKVRDVFFAVIGVTGRRRRIGPFVTPEQASAAYADWAVKQYGEFARP